MSSEGVLCGSAAPTTALAGWGFAQETLRDAHARQEAARWFAQAQVDVFASSHTCLPVFASLGHGLLLNNGAAGMPNFSASKMVNDNIEGLYAYLKGRSDGAIQPGHLEPLQGKAQQGQ